MPADPQPAPAKPGPGRPRSDARERIVAGALEVCKRDGYAGLTTAKVAAASGQNKGLIAYYFGSKQGLVEEVARQTGQQVSATVLASVGAPTNAERLVRGMVDGLWTLLERDPGLQRVYFDFAAQSVVDAEVGGILAEIKAAHRALLVELLAGLPDGPRGQDAEAIAVYLVAGLEGLALERLDRGETPALAGARELFVASASAAIAPR